MLSHDARLAQVKYFRFYVSEPRSFVYSMRVPQAGLTPIKRQRASDEVYAALRQAILTHVFRPGERLQIQDISDKLGVSLTPVRQAIQRLSTEGLIEIHPRSGTYVAKLSAEDIEETFDIRCALECLAAEKAAERISPPLLARMKELLESLNQEPAGEAGVRIHEAGNSAFHAILLEAAGNRRLSEMYESLEANIQIARVHVAEGYRGSRFKQERAEHQEIYRALAARDVPRVTAALRQHIQRAKAALIAGLQDSSR